jgi:hypothetical protein
MNDELKDFFSKVSLEKKNIKLKEIEEQKKEDEYLSGLVKKPDLSNFFSSLAEEKRRIQEQNKLDKKKLDLLEDLLYSRSEKEEEKPKPVIPPIVEEIIEEPKEEVIEEPKIIEKDTKDLVIEELNKISKNTGIEFNEQVKDVDGLKVEFKRFKDLVTRQLGSIGGGGAVNIRDMDDVDRPTIADGLNLQYNATSKKFEFTRPIVSVYPVIRTANAVLIDTPTPTIITDMTLTPPAGTYLVNFNSQFTVDSTSSQTLAAKEDLIVLYDELMALTATGNETVRAGNSLTYGSEILGPGVYIQTGAINVTGTLTLDAGGDPNALFVFRTDGAFTTGVGAEVVLTGQATSSNVFFVSQGASSTAADAIFRGTLLANQAAVSTGAGTTLEGRMLAINGAVSLGAASILTAPTGTINSSLTLGTVLAIFNMFSGQGGVSNTGASEIQLSIGTNDGAITGFATATVGGSLIPGGASPLAIFRCAAYVDGVMVQDSMRTDTRPISLETFEFPFILQTIITLDGTQTVDVRARSLLGIETVGPRMSLILTRVQEQ